jgi:hypothetical protein
MLADEHRPVKRGNGLEARAALMEKLLFTLDIV